MTPVQRDAIRLALSLLRSFRWDENDLDRSLLAFFQNLKSVRGALYLSGSRGDVAPAIVATMESVPPRLLRARIAIALRALLRVGRNDTCRSWMRVQPDGSDDTKGGNLDRRTAEMLARRFGGSMRPVFALWESAPAPKDP